MKFRQMAFLLSLVLSPASGCVTRTYLESAKVKISFGEDVASLSDPVAQSTVSLVNSGGESFCSGTLISPTVVVTAAHCVASYQEKAPIFIAFGLTVNGAQATGERSRSIQSISVHPDYRPVEPPPNGPGYAPDDVALIKMSQSAPQGFVPVTIAQEDWALREGAPVTLAGYGLTKFYFNDQNELINSKDTGTLRKVDGKISDSALWSKRAGMIRFSGLNGKNSCGGDSGGPMFGLQGDKWVLLGATMGGGECGDPRSANNEVEGYYTNLMTRREWIQCVSGVDPSSASDVQPWGTNRCHPKTLKACKKMVVPAEPLSNLAIGRVGSRFFSERSIPPGTVLDIQLQMESWVKFDYPSNRGGFGVTPIEFLQPTEPCDGVDEGTQINIVQETYLKSVPFQSAALAESLKCLLPQGTSLELAVARRPIVSEETGNHIFVTLKKPLPGCPIMTGFLFQDHTEGSTFLP